MSKRNKQYEKEERTVFCEACNGTITLKFYMSRGDMVRCDSCGTQYTVKARRPTRLALLEEELMEYNEYRDVDTHHYEDTLLRDYD